MAYHPKSLRLLGMAQMIIGIAMFCFAVLSIVFVRHWSSYVACGIWVGIWVGLTGMFCYLGAKSNNNPNNCLVGLTIGFGITSCILASVMVIIQSIALAEFGHRLGCPKVQEERSTPNYWDYNHNYDKCDRYNMYNRGYYPSYFEAQKGAGIGSFLLILAVVEFFVALISSIYGCNACTCCPATPSQPTQQVAYLQQQGGNLILISPGGHIPPGATAVQTISAQPGQVVQGGQPQQQGYVVSPQGYPVQAYNPAYPAGTQNKPEEDCPPPYNTIAQ